MGNPLYEQQAAAEWAAGYQVIEITGKLGDFERLSAIVEADLAALDADRIPADWRDAVISGHMEFGFADAQRTLPTALCRVTVTIDALCQRCLEAFRLPLEAEADLLLLELEQAVEGYEEYEVWELEDSLLQPGDIVEEMLIMALPFSAMHADAVACRALLPESETSAAEMTTPFAALRAQMDGDKEGSA